MDTPPTDAEVDRLRAEAADWRRRAEIAEAIAAERLTRAETAEMALDAARSALEAVGDPATSGIRTARPTATPAPGPKTGPEAAAAAAPPAGRSLRERWRRYIESVN